MYKFYSVFVIASCIIVAIRCEDEAKLEIHNTFKPQDCARRAKLTDILTVHYKGTLQDGSVFDSSYDQQPFSFQLGIGQVIRGWDEGLIDICAGEKRRLIIPPHLAYGDREKQTGSGKIPAKATLTFDIECLKVEDGPNPVNVFSEIDINSDGKLSREEVGDFLKKQLSHAGQEESSDHDQMLDEIFKHEDKDSDGFIARDEFSGPKQDHEEL